MTTIVVIATLQEVRACYEKEQAWKSMELIGAPGSAILSSSHYSIVNMLARIFKPSRLQYSRYLSGNAIASPSSGAVAPPSAAPVAKSGGSSLLQRLTAFFVGCGVGFGCSFYTILEELRDSNMRLEKHFQSFEQRLQAVEKSKGK